MKRLLVIIVIVSLACTGVFFYRRAASHTAAASTAPPAKAASEKPASGKPATPKSPVAKSVAAKPASAGGETRDLRLGTFQFSVPVDWMQTNTGSGREVAFGTRDGRLGLSIQLVPIRMAKAFLAAHASYPLPEMTATLDPALSARRTVNGLPVTLTGGTVGYAGGQRYPARFWVYRSERSVLVINAFDGVNVYRKAIHAVAQSVRPFKPTHLVAASPSEPGSPFRAMEQRFLHLAHL